MEIGVAIQQLIADGTLARLMNNPSAQFGRERRQYLGAQFLPEKRVEENAYREEGIRYRTIVANDGDRYSPAKIKGGDILGSMLVELGNSDIAREFKADAYDAMLRLMNNNASMQAMTSLTNWVDSVINLALIEHNERQRWQAIVGASVVREGDNAYSETVAYPNPTGHRAAASAAWSTVTTDIFSDIAAMVDLLASKGYTVSRIVTSRQVLSWMSTNDTIKTRTGVAVVNGSGQITSAVGRASTDAINTMLQRDGLPAIELYDLQYRTSEGSGYFLPRNTMVLFATGGMDQQFDLGDSENIPATPDRIGYSAIGRAAGQSAPGRVVVMEHFNRKPPRIEAEGWQTSLPVITEPEAIAVINSIT